MRAQRRASPGCLGLQGQKDVVAVLPTGFERSLIYQLLAAVKLRQREKNVKLVASPLRSIIKYDQVEAMREAGVSAIALGTLRSNGATATITSLKK